MPCGQGVGVYKQVVIFTLLCYFLCMINTMKKITKYLSREEPIIAAYLFGSAAKGGATEKSDIDIGLLLKKDFNLVSNFDYKLRLMGELKDLAGKAVDIVFIDRTDPILQHHIRKHGKIIFERDKRKRIVYEIKARKDYFDFLFRHKKYMEEMLKSF